MQIKIKSTRVIKEGVRKDKSPYKWCSVIVDDGSEKGTEYTTFDTGVLNLGAGSVIEIGEPKIKEGKLSFKDFKVVSEVKAEASAGPGATAPPPPGGAGYKRDAEGIRLEYELRGKIEAQKNASIEGQAVMNGALEVLKHFGKVPEEPKELKDLVMAGLRWGLKAVGASGAPVEKKAEPKTEAPKKAEEGGPEPVELPRFKDGTALVNYALKHDWKIERIRASLGIQTPTEIKDLEAAAKVLFGPYIHFAEEPELPF